MLAETTAIYIANQLERGGGRNFLPLAYRTRALLSAYAFISTGRKWAPMLETQLNNE